MIGAHAGAQTPLRQATPEIEQSVPVFGQRLHFLEAGSGPALILIHGLADSLEVWRAQIPSLANRYHVIALDLIGFGRSDKPMINYRAETLVDFLDEFMRARGLRQATLVGNSLGGWVAALMSIEHPERVNALVLVDSAGLDGMPGALGPLALKALRLSSIDDLKVLAPLTFADPNYYQPDEVLRKAFADRLAAGDGYAVSQIVDSIVRGDDVLDPRLNQIHCRTLIVWGRQDGLIPLRFGEQLHHGILGSKLSVINHCAHEPQVECPTAFQSELESFLGQLKPQARSGTNH